MDPQAVPGRWTRRSRRGAALSLLAGIVVTVTICASATQAMPYLSQASSFNRLGVLADGTHGDTTGREPPEIGRCVSDPGKGEFKGSSPVCIFTSPSHTGNFEWLPGAGANGSFAEIVAQPTLETVTGSKIGCVYLFVNGVITGGKTARISEVRMQQCEVLYTRVPCYTTSSEPGTIKSTIPLVGELGFIPGAVHPSSPRVGWDLRAESELSPTVVEFSCGQDQASRYEVSLKGSVIGRITKTNKMITSGRFELFYKEEKGIQNPTAFIAGPEDVLTQITTPVLDPSARQEEQVGLRGTGNRNSNGDNTGVLEVSEPIEIKAK